MERQKIEGINVSELQMLLQSPGWDVLQAELRWREHQACESLRGCSPEELRKIQGRAQALRESVDLPKNLIAEWRIQNEGK